MARDARHGLVEVGSLSLRWGCGAAPPAADSLSVKLKLKNPMPGIDAVRSST